MRGTDSKVSPQTMGTGPQTTGARCNVKIFGRWCKDCGICVELCPRKVLETDGAGHPVVAHPERCTACNWCVIHCPDFAIVVRPVDGIAAVGESEEP